MDAISVLVVDNDAGMREILRLILELEGYSVDEAHNGYQALDYLRTRVQPLVVLLDWQMPGLSGLDVLQILAADIPQACHHAYILYTAANHPLDLLALVPAGFRVVALSKFSPLDELLRAIKQEANEIVGKQ